MIKGSILYRAIVCLIFCFSWSPIYSSSCCGSNDCKVCSTCEYCEYCNDDSGSCSVCVQKNESNFFDGLINFLIGCFKIMLFPLLFMLYIPLVKIYFSLKNKQPIREVGSGLEIIKRSSALTFLMMVWGYIMMYLWFKGIMQL